MAREAVWRLYDGKFLKVSLNVEIRDLWIGVFWRWTDFLHVYVCLVPCLPLHFIYWPRSRR